MFVSSQMIYQQPNPGVHYEFIMPSENAVDAQRPEENQLDGESIQQILTGHLACFSIAFFPYYALTMWKWQHSVYCILCCSTVNVVNGQTDSDANGQSTLEGHEGSGVKHPPPIPDNQLPAAPPSTRFREYNWKLSGSTDCSASCGRGQKHIMTERRNTVKWFSQS